MASVTDVENHFGEYLEKAQQEPVTVEKTGRKYAVLLSFEEYERLRLLEDRDWGERARQAERSGFLTPEESLQYLQDGLKAA